MGKKNIQLIIKKENTMVSGFFIMINMEIKRVSSSIINCQKNSGKLFIIK